MTDSEPHEYLEASPFYRLMEQDGAIGLMDVLLRKHYTALSVDDLSTVTGSDPARLESLLQQFQDHGLIRRNSEGDVVLLKESDAVQAFRNAQTSLLGK